MTGFEWLAALTSLVELIGSLIPRRIQVPPNSRGVKFTGMKKVSVIKPGNHWVWPFRSEIKVFDIMPRTVDLAVQDVTAANDDTYRVDASILLSVYPDDNSILKAFFENTRIEDIAATEGMHVLCNLINESDKSVLHNRREFDRILTKRIRKRLKNFGLKTHRAYVATMASGMPVIILGGK
jgi:regulator of protease activity HflC (stomatin/prohibitin superfamily)